jgi:transcriptional regulator with XRE-family HTH domain
MATTKQRKPGKAPEAVLFGQSLRRLRTERGWSQDRLAEAAGITLNYVGNLERGEQGPSLHILIRLARALDVDLATLVSDFRRDAIRKLRLR